jgi:hypothetical protein
MSGNKNPAASSLSGNVLGRDAIESYIARQLAGY